MFCPQPEPCDKHPLTHSHQIYLAKTRSKIECILVHSLPLSKLSLLLDSLGIGYIHQNNQPPDNAIVCMFGGRRLVLEVLVEIAMVALAGVMVCETWTVGSEIMITWRCEYGFLLFCWQVSHHFR